MRRYFPLFLFLFVLFLSLYGLNSCSSGGDSSDSGDDPPANENPPASACDPTAGISATEVKYVAVGSEFTTDGKKEGVVLVSKNGEDWHPVKCHGLKGGSAVTYGDGRFVIVSGGPPDTNSGLEQFFAVSSDGIKWRTILNKGTNAEEKISFGNKIFVTSVHQKDGVKVLKSPYTELAEVIDANSGSNGTLATVYAGETINKFLVVGIKGKVLFYNPTNDSLESKSVGVFDKTVRAGIYTGSRFVVVGDSGSIFTSATGSADTWTDGIPSLNLGTIVLRGIAYNGSNKFVVIGESGTVLTASDATASSWSKVTTAVIGEDDELNNVSYLHGKFFIVSGTRSNGDGKIFTSTDGTTWTKRYSNPAVVFGGVAAKP